MTTSQGQNPPVRFSLELMDGAINGWRWANPERPPLLFLHATGFCASAYRQMLSAIAGEFDIYALDFRGHGRSTLTAQPSRLRSWRPFVDDVRSFLNAKARTRWTLSGHSLGAATALMAASGRSDVAALKLIEPVAAPEWVTVVAKTPVWPLFSSRIGLVRMAARRRAHWADRASVTTSYARKALFKSWAPGVLEDYLEDGLTDQFADGAASVSLACAPAWEAATFAAQGNDFWRATRAAPAPVGILAADHHSSTIPAAARRRFARLGASVRVQSGVSHLAPMEAPGEIAAYLAG